MVKCNIFSFFLSLPVSVSVSVFVFVCVSVSVCGVGGGSASKEQNKKKSAENKEVPDVETLAFSPERRWVYFRTAEGSEARALYSQLNWLNDDGGAYWGSLNMVNSVKFCPK